MRVRLAQPSVGPVEKFLAARWLPHVRELLLDNFNLGPGAVRLLGSNRLAGLTRLELDRTSGARETEDLATVLAASPVFAAVKQFRLAHWTGDGPALARLLAASAVEDLRLDSTSVDYEALLAGKSAARLKRLELRGVAPRAWRAFAGKRARPAVTHLGLTGLNEPKLDLGGVLDAPACRNLVALDMSESRVRKDAVRGLAGTAFWRRCRELRLIRGQCPPAVAARLAKGGPPALRVLKLGETGLRDAGVRHLCAAPWAASLVELDLMRNHLTDDACEAIRDGGGFVHLRHLDIRTNGPKLARGAKERITDEGLAALASAPCLARLRHLNMHSLPVTSRGVDAVINSPVWNLSELDVGGTEIGADGIRVLAKSPNLARLTRLNLSFISNLKDDDLLPLAESEYLSPVCEVSVMYYRLGNKVRTALQSRLGRHLRA